MQSCVGDANAPFSLFWWKNIRVTPVQAKPCIWTKMLTLKNLRKQRARRKQLFFLCSSLVCVCVLNRHTGGISPFWKMAWFCLLNITRTWKIPGSKSAYASVMPTWLEETAAMGWGLCFVCWIFVSLHFLRGSWLSFCKKIEFICQQLCALNNCLFSDLIWLKQMN